MLTTDSESFLDVDKMWRLCEFYGVAKSRFAVKTEINLLNITFENGGDDLPKDLMCMLNFVETHKRVPVHYAQGSTHRRYHPSKLSPVERTFSSMKRIKTFLSSNMGNTGLSDIGVLNVNAQMLDRLDRETVVNRFAETPRRILL